MLTSPASAIDYDRARDLDGEPGAPAGEPADPRTLLRSRPLAIFAVCAMLSRAPSPRSRVIGASLSGLFAGVIVDTLGYTAAFLAAGGAALVALSVFALRMPETVDRPPRLATPDAIGVHP